MNAHYDVAIVGGGPGGSTTGGILRKYDPAIRVLIAERAKFPREHVGESQLPQIGEILHELGVWDAVESAGFPIKIGATYLWGRSPELWDFNFVPPDRFQTQARPAPYAGQRRSTALQVERALYDEILLNHAQKLGCDVRQETGVTKVHHADDRVTGLDLSDGTRVTADHYIDASGHPAIIRRALGVPIDCPTALKNVAAWDYWDNAAWADSIGVGGTRVQVISVGYGWIWFIPLGPTRTSIGLVCPASYYIASGKTMPELYDLALASSERIQGLIKNATREGKVRTTNDWSFVSERTAGPNWMLVGESAGFADPILAAGLTLTHVGGREAAYTILAERQGGFDANWLRHHYHLNQIRRVRQHMRFAEFWYSANGQFTDLQDHCREIAQESGLTLDAKKAWAWLAQGGFTNDVLGQAVIGGFDVGSMKRVTEMFAEEDLPWQTNDRNVFRLNLDGATRERVPDYRNGQVTAVDCYLKAGRRLPLTGLSLLLVSILQKTSDAATLVNSLIAYARQHFKAPDDSAVVRQSLHLLEVLIGEGWVDAAHDPARPSLHLDGSKGDLIRGHVGYPARA